ncbi:MAG: Ig-like domain-containing protein [Marinifilaceae bacterium]
MRNRIRQCFVCLVVFTTLFSCSKKETSVSVSGVSLSEVKHTLEVDGQLTLLATVSPSNAVNKTVIWTSDAPDVAKVELVLNENGVPVGSVTALKVGEANIVATTTSGRKIAKCVITVIKKKIFVESLEIESIKDYVYIGSTLQIDAIIKPLNATERKIIWTSSNTNIAKIDDTGLIQGIAIGTTEIQAKIGEKVATCNITVKEHVKSVVIDPKRGYVIVGKTLQVNASVLPVTATNKALVWSTNSKTSAPVDKNGLVTANSKGVYTITATPMEYCVRNEEGEYTAKRDAIQVTFEITIAEIIDIKDKLFLKELVEQGVDGNPGVKIDINDDKKIDTYEASLATELIIDNTDLAGEDKITDLSGVKYFKNIKKLECKNIDITSLDVSNMNIETLDLINVTNLKELICAGNNSSSFVLTGCSSMINLKTIDLTDCAGLKILDCKKSGVTSISLSGCTGLTDLNCSECLLRKLDIFHCSALSVLSCNINKNLDLLDVTKCPSLTELFCLGCKLENLDVTKCSNLIKLNCQENQIGLLDISKCTKLEFMSCEKNPLTIIYSWKTDFDGYKFFKDSKAKYVLKR